MIDITTTEQQITNNLQAFDDYVQKVRAAEYLLEDAADNDVAKGIKKQIATYKKFMKNHLLQAQSLAQQVKSYGDTK
jgi:hypothetical protein